MTEIPQRLIDILISFADDSNPMSVEEIGEALGHTHGEYGADELFALIKSIYEKFSDEGDEGYELLIKLAIYFSREIFKIQREDSDENEKLQQVIEEYFKDENKTGK